MFQIWNDDSQFSGVVHQRFGATVGVFGAIADIAELDKIRDILKGLEKAERELPARRAGQALTSSRRFG